MHLGFTYIDVANKCNSNEKTGTSNDERLAGPYPLGNLTWHSQTNFKVSHVGLMEKTI